MAITRVKVWANAEILTAADLNGEFNNIIDNALSAVSPWTGNMSAGGFRLIGLGLGSVSDPAVQFTGDTNTGIFSSAADTLDVSVGGVRTERHNTVASGVNFVDLTAAATGNGPLIAAAGSDANVSLNLNTKGTGTVNLSPRGATNRYIFDSTAGGAFNATFTHAATANRTYTLQNATGTLAFLTDVVGEYAIRNLVGNNNAVTPDTQYDMSADLVALRNTSDFSVVVRTATGTITNNTGLAGPAANGRDVAGAFAASQFIHFYFIWNGTTLATVSSSTAPTTGPVLPTGYTHWAYAGSVRYNATPLLVRTRWRGVWASYEVAQNALNTTTPASTETAISLTTLVPANALMINVVGERDGAIGATATGIGVLTLRYITASNYTVVNAYDMAASTAGDANREAFIVPNQVQQLFYLDTRVGTGGTVTVKVDVLGYSMPNGGE